MEQEIIIKRMVGECSSSVTDSTIDGGLIKKILDMFYIKKYASVTEIAYILLFLRKPMKSDVINGKETIF